MEPPYSHPYAGIGESRDVARYVSTGALVSSSDACYGVPEGAPATCQAKARNDEADKSIAGSTVE